MTRIDTPVPCVSRGSVVSGLDGVYFASEDGLVRVNSSGVEIVTASYISKHEWTSYYPEYIRGVAYRGGYLGWVCATSTNGGFYFSTGDSRVAFTTLMDMGGDIKNVQSDPYTGTVYIISADYVWEWDPRDQTEQLPYLWASKRFQTGKRCNFAAARLFIDAIPGSPSSNIWMTQAASTFTGYSTSDYFQLKVYCDGVLVFTGNYAATPNLGPIIRLPSTMKGTYWRFEIVGRVRVRELQMATSAKELASV